VDYSSCRNLNRNEDSTSNYKMFRFALNVSPHYLVPDKTKAIDRNSSFWSQFRNILILNSKHELHEQYFYWFPVLVRKFLCQPFSRKFFYIPTGINQKQATRFFMAHSVVISSRNSLSTLSQKSATVAEFRRCLAVFGDSLSFLWQSHFSATVWTGLNTFTPLCLIGS